MEEATSNGGFSHYGNYIKFFRIDVINTATIGCKFVSDNTKIYLFNNAFFDIGLKDRDSR